MPTIITAKPLAYKEGFSAAQHGYCADDCLYDPYTEEWCDWIDGYEDGKKVRVH